MNQLLPSSALLSANFTPYLVRVDLDNVNCGELARHLTRRHPLRRPRLIIDCQPLNCIRTHGVAHFVGQLLLLHATGAQIVLLNVEPVVQRCLRLLRLDAVFHLATDLAVAA